MPELIGKKVIVRYFTLDDFKDFYEFSSDPRVGYTAGWKPHTDEITSRRILQAKVYSAQNFAIVEKESGKVVGSIELNPSHIRERIKAFEIGFALNPDYWGLGYAKEATMLLCEYAFKEQKALVLEMCHIADNIQSEHVALACGFTYEGTIKAYKLMYDKRIVDVKLYHLTLEEYKRMK
jgi:putative acetyltransferase